MTNIVIKISKVANGIGVSIVGLMALLLTADVLLRYIFNKTIPSVFEFVQLMMVIVVSFGMAHCTLQKRQIVVDTVTSRFPHTVQAAIDSIVLLISLGFVLLMSWQTFLHAHNTLIRKIYTGILEVPVSPFIFIMAFCMVLLALALLVNTVDSFRIALKGGVKVWVGAIVGIIFSLFIIISPLLLKQLHWEINKISIGIIGMVILFLFIFARMPIGFAMLSVGVLGLSCLNNLGAAISILGSVPYHRTTDYTLSALPLFVLMGMFAFSSGIIQSFFRFLNKWLGGIRGGLAMATVMGCTGFSAICSSSTVTAVLMGQIAYPEMKRYGYDSKLTTGSIAAGGTLGILIPPSAGFIIYALFTEQSIGKLFLGGVLPGLLLTALFMLVIYIIVRFQPDLGPAGDKVNFKEKIASIHGLWLVGALFFLVMGGIYFGIVTATESAAIGALGAFIIGILKKQLNRQDIIESMLEAGQVTSMVFIIIIGASIFNEFIVVAGLNTTILNIISGMKQPPVVILIAILFMYLVLGGLMDFFSMTALTLPIVFPLILSLGYDPIWFGVIVVIMMELAMITPPIGINMFALSTIIPDVPMYTIFRGAIPFIFAMVILLIILIIFPQIALFLPNLSG